MQSQIVLNREKHCHTGYNYAWLTEGLRLIQSFSNQQHREYVMVGSQKQLSKTMSLMF